MKNKGFTIVELLGVFIVFVIIMSIAVLGIGSVINTGKKGVYKNHEATSRSAAENYLVDNTDNIPKSGNFLKIPLYDLINNEYLKELKDPNNGTCDYDESYVAILRGNDTTDNYNLTYYTCLVFKDKDGNVTYKSSGCEIDLEKELSTSDNCFDYNMYDGKITIFNYNASCGSDVVIPSKLPLKIYTLNNNLTNNELNKCIEYTSSWNFDDGETPDAFCNGTGSYQGAKFQNMLNENLFENSDLVYFVANNIVIQSKGNEYPVTSIMGGAFSNKGLTSVSIPNGVTYIGDSAFIDNSLTDIVIPDSVTSIGTYSFSDNNINTVSIGKSVTSIGSHSFLRNPVTTLKINTVTTPYGEYVGSFLSKISLNDVRNIIIGDDVEVISNYSFGSYSGGGKVLSVVIGKNVKRIGEAAFMNNKISKVVIPDSVTYIGTSAFSYNHITDLTLGSSLDEIQGNAFLGNSIGTLNIPNSVSTIYTDAFKYNNLRSVKVGNGVTYISGGVFDKSDFSFTPTVDGVPDYTYYSNPNLTSVSFDKSCDDIKKMNGYPFLSSSYPHKASGVTIYGSGNVVCDTY